MNYLKRAKEIVKELTLDQKIALSTGKDFWHLSSVREKGLPEIMVTDGPSGLRKQCDDADMLGLNKSVAATCMPGACTTACSFDPELLYEVGQALGEECQKEDVSVLLGPGANTKRSPICGRNFEYFSEDPLLAGEMSAAFINGVQSKDVGTSLKHYACNSQETRRMISDSIVDERAFRELYLTNYEIPVKKAQPWTVMYAYNHVNGPYCYENKYLLTDILRDEWGYKGLTVSDWGACGNIVDAIKNGANLEMPGPVRLSRERLKTAIENGELTEQELDENTAVIVELILKSKANLEKRNTTCSMQDNHNVAIKAAKESMVLLKNNNGVLPLKEGMNVAIIGKFAKQARYQGAGSSQVNAYLIEEAYDAFKTAGINMEYADGYVDEATKPNVKLMNEACDVAKGKDAVVVFVGLPSSYESEGFDRKDMKIPEAHIRLVEALKRVNDKVIVVLMCGSPVEVAFEESADAILLAYLGGQGVGRAVVDLIMGKASPCGKLAETWPLKVEDNPSYTSYFGGRATVEYRESIFVGYRYYETANKPVRYPFGYGLSYSNFEYSNLKLDKDTMSDSDELTVSFEIKNTGKVLAKEIAQIYVSHKNETVYMPALELKGFKKVELKPGQKKKVEIRLSKRAFAYYNTLINDWYVDSGDYTISVGKSCADIVLTANINITSEEKPQPDYRKTAASYYNLKNEELNVSAKEFEVVYGKPLPEMDPVMGRPYDSFTTIDDLKNIKAGKFINKAIDVVAGVLAKKNPGIAQMMEAMVKDMPIRSFVGFTGDVVGQKELKGIVNILNGNVRTGIKEIIKK